MTRFPVTPAILFLKKTGIEYTEYLYSYNKSGAIAAARNLGVEPHKVIKTLVMEDDQGNYFLVLMHGEKEVSLKKLARELNVKKVSTASKKNAKRLTGYSIGGISPFGTRKNLSVIVEKTILDLPEIYINAGRRGFIVKLMPYDLVNVLQPSIMQVAR